jgi:V8-like Glu-specific endopeptidase
LIKVCLALWTFWALLTGDQLSKLTAEPALFLEADLPVTVQADAFYFDGTLILESGENESEKRENRYLNPSEHDFEYVRYSNDPNLDLFSTTGRLEVIRFNSNKKLLDINLCTAFWIDGFHVLTARHCLGESRPDQVLLRTRYLIDGEENYSSHSKSIPGWQGYEVYALDPEPVDEGKVNDWAILRLHPSDPQLSKIGVPKWHWAKLNLGGSSERLYEPFLGTRHVLSHPMGTFLKITSRGCRGAIGASFANVVLHQCYTDEGSSGAPLLDLSGSVTAIHIAKRRKLVDIAVEFNDDGAQRSILEQTNPNLVASAGFRTKDEVLATARKQNSERWFEREYSTAIHLLAVYNQSEIFRQIVRGRYEGLAIAYDEHNLDPKRTPILPSEKVRVDAIASSCVVRNPDQNQAIGGAVATNYRANGSLVRDYGFRGAEYRLHVVERLSEEAPSGEISERINRWFVVEHPYRDRASYSSDLTLTIDDLEPLGETPKVFARVYPMPYRLSRSSYSVDEYGLSTDFDVPSPFDGYSSPCVAVELTCIDGAKCISSFKNRYRYSEADVDSQKRMPPADGNLSKAAYGQLLANSPYVVADTDEKSEVVFFARREEVLPLLEAIEIAYFDYSRPNTRE